MIANKKTVRVGAYVVEFAFVVIIFLMVLFAIMEYSRFIFIRQTIEQAAREGARFAVVSTDSPTVEADTIALVKQKMSGVDTMVQNYNCQVYEADSKGTKSGSAADASFGEYVVVQIDCDYKPFLPSFLYLQSTLPLSAKALMYSESN